MSGMSQRIVFGNAQRQKFMSDEAIRNASESTLLWALDPEGEFHFTVKNKCREELKRRRHVR